MRSTTNAPIARQKPELQVTRVFRSAAAEIAQLRFALDLCWQALDICEPVPENNGVGEIEREAALAACRALIGGKSGEHRFFPREIASLARNNSRG